MIKAEPPAVVIAEELTLVRDGLAALCEQDGRARVVAAVSDGAEAWDAIERLDPDLALVDLQVAGTPALELARRLAVPESGGPARRTRCILTGIRSDRKTVIELLRAGAHGYLLKSSSKKHLWDCIQQVLDGGIYVSPNIDIRSLFYPGGRAMESDPLSLLSPREYQVFLLLVEGIRQKEIAARLELSPKTIDTYRAGLMKKLGIHDVPGLVLLAMQLGLIKA